MKLETERYNTFALYFGAEDNKTKAAKESLVEVTHAKVVNDVSAARNKISSANAIARNDGGQEEERRRRGGEGVAGMIGE